LILYFLFDIITEIRTDTRGFFMIKSIENMGYNSGNLDAIIYDVFSKKASFINNKGREEQEKTVGNNSEYLTIEDFDDIVHQKGEEDASIINNGGLNSQISFLKSKGLTEKEILKLIRDYNE
jgi:hypothetical protein